MNDSRTKTLLMPMLEFPKDYEDAANRWFDGDHVPQRLSAAGFISCERFQRTDIEPPGYMPEERASKYLTMYTIDGPEVLDAEGYKLQLAGLENPRLAHLRRQYGGPGRGEFRSSLRSIRTLWTLRPSPWTRNSEVTLRPPRSIFVVMRDFDAAHDAEINREIDDHEVPEILSCPGFIRCERFEIVHGLTWTEGHAVALQPAYMDVYDMATPEVATSDSYWRYWSSRSDAARKLAALTTVRGRGVFLQRPAPWVVASVR